MVGEIFLMFPMFPPFARRQQIIVEIFFGVRNFALVFARQRNVPRDLCCKLGQGLYKIGVHDVDRARRPVN